MDVWPSCDIDSELQNIPPCFGFISSAPSKHDYLERRVGSYGYFTVELVRLATNRRQRRAGGADEEGRCPHLDTQLQVRHSNSLEQMGST